MATANTKSTAITNADASPRTANSSYLEAGGLRISSATVEVAAADDNASTYRMCRLPSGARIVKVDLFNDAITVGTDYDLGFYKNAGDGGAVVDKDTLATAVDMSSARTTPLDLTWEVHDINGIEKRIYELTGIALAADPFLEYDLVFTANTVGTAAGTISINVYWTL